MRRRSTRISLGAAVLLAASTAAAQTFEARLGRVPVDGRNQADVQGIGHAEAELEGDRLVVSGEFEGLVGAATAANLHLSPVVGVRGPAVHELEITATREGRLSGSVRLDAEQLAALRAGRLYVQIASESAPDGNLWGWLFTE